ncbi:MAG: ABC transporter substrate-binding protein [Candidatus Melainabacteria bacterium]
MRNRLRCIVSVFVAGLLLSAALSACGQKTAATSALEKRPVQLAFWTLQLSEFSGVIQPMLDDFEKAHPTVHVHWVDIPFSEGEKRTLTAILSPEVPDIVNLNPDFSAILASRNALVNMADALTPAERAVYLPVAWQAATLRRPGKKSRPLTFGLPWYITSSVTFYNKALLARAGLKAPPRNYDELVRMAPELHRKTDAYTLMPTLTERGNFLKELQKVGVTLHNPATGQFNLAVPEAFRHLTRMVDLYRNGGMPAEALTEGHRSAVDRYQSGTLAMLMAGPNFLNIVKENAPAVFEQTGVMPQFPIGAPTRDFSMMVLVVPRHSRHPREALELARWITNAGNQLALAKAAPVLPATTASLADPYFNAPATPDDVTAVARGISASQLKEARAAYQIQPGQQRMNEWMDYFVQMALLGKLRADEALTRAEGELNTVLKEETP